jgi:hypothetical protein
MRRPDWRDESHGEKSLERKLFGVSAATLPHGPMLSARSPRSASSWEVNGQSKILNRPTFSLIRRDKNLKPVGRAASVGENAAIFAVN